MTDINFYETSKAYGCFSNFSRHPVQIDDRTWLTVEHFFQASKFMSLADIEEIHAAETPFVAAQLGRDRSRRMRPDWDAVRDTIMLKALQAKFAQQS